MTTTAETPSQHTVEPSEVGWQFVPQYYTFVNKQPNRLHCFYTKASTFIHGTEGEDGKPCFGQQEIHNKITSIGFEDCKVFIHSVDAQSSANGGIIIQVIGEMSNRGEPWRKFVQTFFLAEQPNGYFVLNDIFRFLKEETVEENPDASPESEPTLEPSVSEAVAPPASSVQESESAIAPAIPEPAVEEPAAEEPASAPAAEVEVEVEAEVEVEVEVEAEAEAEVEEETAAPAQGNGHAKPETVPEPELPSAPVAEKAATPAPAPVAEPSKPSTPAPAPSVPTATAPSPAAAPSPAPSAPPTQPAPPQPVAPPQPKTWANLAAANSKKWGSAVAQESRGTSEAPAASTSTPASGTQTPTHTGPRPVVRPPSEQSPLMAAALATPTPQCFVKSVQENISESALRQVLTTRFGAIKELEIVRSKACAFLEFVSLDAARRAIAASLPLREGGEGGIRIETNDGSQGNIRVEVRKERGERPVSRPRGGGPPMNGERGGFRGRGAPRGRGIGTK